MKPEEIQQELVEIIDGLSKGDGSASLSGVIQRFQERAQRRGQSHVPPGDQRLVLQAYYELHRTGALCWGLDFTNLGGTHAHVTLHGRKVLEHATRDPSNQAGYKRAIDPFVPVGTTARSYVDEALVTFATGCEKATAVMIGAAAEALLLELRDELVVQMKAKGKAVPKALEAWQAKTVHDAVREDLEKHRKSMPRDLSESFDVQLGLGASLLRISRNDAGHPKSIDPVTRDDVHGNLLLFHSYAKWMRELREWAKTSYS